MNAIQHAEIRGTAQRSAMGAARTAARYLAVSRGMSGMSGMSIFINEMESAP